MKIAIAMMTCEKDYGITGVTMTRIIEILAGMSIDFYIYDDGSQSRVGDKLVRQFLTQTHVRVFVLRGDSPKGYLRIVENFLVLLRFIAESNEGYTYILRTDPDVHFCSRRLQEVLLASSLPIEGVIAPTFSLRSRDFVLFCADLLPVGFRRARRGGKVVRTWEFAGLHKLWWRDLGLKALRQGYRGEVTPGSFMIITGVTLNAIYNAGFLQRDFTQIGLLFGDDVFIGIMTKALGHPLYDISRFVKNWACEMFLKPDAALDQYKNPNIVFVHPLKDDPWSYGVRSYLTKSERIGA